MRQFFIRLYAVLMLAVMTTPALAGSDDPIKFLYQLPREAQYASLLSANGHIFAGVDSYNIDDPAGGHHILVFDPATLAKPEVIRLRHAPQFMIRYSADQIVTTGLSAFGDPPWFRSHVSFIRKSGVSWSVQTYDFPDRSSTSPSFPYVIAVKQPAQVGGKLYFGLRRGENALMEYRAAGSHRKLPERIIMPEFIVDAGSFMMVTERDFEDNIFRVDPATGRGVKLLPRGIGHHFNDAKWDAVQGTLMTTGDQGINWFDPASGAVTETVLVKGQAGGIAFSGTCKLVTDISERRVNLLRLRSGRHEIVKTWDIDIFGQQIETLDAVQVDEPTGQVFVRGTRSCPYCGHSPNGLAVIDARAELNQHCRGGSID